MTILFNKEKLLNKSADVFIYVSLIVIAFITLFPFWYCFVGSLNEGMDYMKGGVFFLPRRFTLGNFKVVLKDSEILSSYWVTILRTVIGTTTHVLFTSLFAYAYSRKILAGKKFFMIVCMIPMFISGGLIPRYILYTKLGLIDNFLVYVIPGLFNFWHVIILQANFRGLPDGLIEAATIDGAREYKIYWYIIMPLSLPVLAAIALFTAVGHWNSYFDSMVFTKTPWLQTVQVYLFKLIKSREFAAAMATNQNVDPSLIEDVTSETIQMATMMAVTIPIILVYPFLQKYFVKGMLIGSVKG